MKKIYLLPVFFFYTSLSFSQLADSLKQHIDTAIAIMKQHSLYAAKVNWIAAREQAYKDAAGAKNKEQLFNAIANAYRSLNDHHGWFEQYNDKISLPDSSAIKRYSPSLIKEWAKGPVIKTQMPGSIAYLRIPGMPAFTQKQIDFYANWLADSINSLAGKKPTAWIIDLRLNTGGNITPMMAALSCFFKDGILSYYLDKGNKPVSVSRINNGSFYLDDTIHANIKHSLQRFTKIKIAVITGAGTASSGEGVAAAFKERKNCRLFGEQTAGVANSTEGFVFNNDNSYFLITTAQLGNKKKKPLPAFVLPGTVIKNNDSFEDIMNDNAVMAAIQWLQ